MSIERRKKYVFELLINENGHRTKLKLCSNESANYQKRNEKLFTEWLSERNAHHH